MSAGDWIEMKSDCTEDRSLERSPEEVAAEAKLRQEFAEKCAEVLEFMDFLEIPFSKPQMWERIPPKVSVFTLYDILRDEERVKTIVSKLKMKAFW